MSPNVRRLLVALFALATVGAGLAQSGGGYDLSWHLVSSGGRTSVGGRYILPGSIGQPQVGVLAGGSYTLRAGFWQSFAPAIPGAPLAVNTTDDTDDGACDAGHCSLREAINAANANPGPDTIAFDIPPSDPGYNPAGWWTTRPTSPLPSVDRDGTTIDGTTQTANQGDANPLGPEIELDGSLAGEDGYGIDIRSSDNVVRGLVINRFPTQAIWLYGDGAANNRIVGNYLGTDPTGTQDRGNAWGIYIYRGAHDNTVGGPASQDRNLISGNDQQGIGLISAGADGNRIVGNFIGTDAEGSGALGNTYDGVSIAFGAQRNVIGPGNVIAFNGRNGVRVNSSDSLSNTVSANSIYRNTGKGIFLEDGGNADLAPPVITAVSATQASGTACTGCTVEVFSDDEDEGAVYEGSTTADGAGNWVFTKPDGLAGPNVTATATDEAGNTSEFSAPVRIAGTATPTPTSTPTSTPTPTPTATVGAPPALVVNTTDDADDGTCDAGHCSLREAINAADRYAGPDTIAFNIPPTDPGYNSGGWWTIRPADPLPSVDRDGTTIDGTTQTASRGDTNSLGPEIELDGSLVGESGRGFYVTSANNVIRGLTINRFAVSGIWLQGQQAANNRSVGNYLGTDPTGTQDRGNGWGIYIYLGAHDNTVGGPAPEDRNLISGNDQGGIGLISAGADSNRIIGNFIGTDAEGSGALGNTYDGVSIAFGAQRNVIGPGNVIAFNGGDGVRVNSSDSLSNTVSANGIYRNTGKGIFLVDGGNLELAPPVIAVISGGQVSGTVCPGCTVEIFSDFEDEGRTFEGTTVADAAGNWSLDVSPAGPNVTATATDGAGNTSEFSLPVVVLHNRVYLPLVRR